MPCRKYYPFVEVCKKSWQESEAMQGIWAENFHEIIEALRNNADLLQSVKNLIETREITGKSLEGGNRLCVFKDILTNLVDGNIGLEESYMMVETKISRYSSIHGSNNRVFPESWGERLIRTNLSKFYNQAVLLYILESGKDNCYIPHSKYEQGSQCSYMAGKTHNAKEMLQKIEQAYEKGIFSKEFKIPDHPHCTHVVMPVE